MYEFSDKPCFDPFQEFCEPKSPIEIVPDYGDNTRAVTEDLSADTAVIGIPENRGELTDNIEPTTVVAASAGADNDGPQQTHRRFWVDLSKFLQEEQEPSTELKPVIEVKPAMPEPHHEIIDINNDEPDVLELPAPQLQTEVDVPDPTPELPNIPEAVESDVASRLDRFEEIKEGVEWLTERGALEGIPEGVRYYLDRMVAVGVNEKGEVVRPEGYRPEEMVPVLVVKPGEAVDKYTLPGLVSEAEAAERIIESTGTLVSISADMLDGVVRATLSQNVSAQIRYSELLVAPRDSPDQPYPVNLPRLVVLSESVPDTDWADSVQTVVHEIDHWDHAVNVAPNLGDESGKRYSAVQLQSVAEKFAYDTQYTLAKNLGHYDHVESPEELAEPFKVAGFSAEFAGSMAAMPASLQRHLVSACIPERSLMPFIVKAISYMYGHPDKLITDEEVIAFRNIGILGGH